MTSPTVQNSTAFSPLIQLLRDHVDFIVLSSDAYDEGYQGEAKRFATSLRTLFHDALPFRSLMAQADGLTTKFISTAVPRGTDNLIKYGGLIRAAKFDGRPIYYAPLDSAWYARFTSFSDWWNELVFVDDQQTELSRRDLVVSISNKGGGSNVHSDLTNLYTRLSEHESLGWNQQPGENFISAPERAAIRQIAHETLRTLLPPYRKSPRGEADPRLAAAMVKSYERPSSIPPSQVCRRNDPCPCGSTKRFKFCHGGI